MKSILFLLVLQFGAFAQTPLCDAEDPAVRDYLHNWTKCQRTSPTVIDKPARIDIDSITKKIVVVPATFKTLPKKRCTCFDNCYKKNKTTPPSTNIQFHPNPAADFLTISMPNSNLLNFQLVDLNGKIVLETSIQNEKILDTTQIPNGIYFMLFRENCILYRNKIIVQH